MKHMYQHMLVYCFLEVHWILSHKCKHYITNVHTLNCLSPVGTVECGCCPTAPIGTRIIFLASLFFLHSCSSLLTRHAIEALQEWYKSLSNLNDCHQTPWQPCMKESVKKVEGFSWLRGVKVGQLFAHIWMFCSDQLTQICDMTQSH